MAVDYAEKEREFINGLMADTGRDLSGWMTAIREQNIKERNALIDWLRMQGFTFARASWMERIHHNGGKLIYAGDVVPAHVEPLAPAPKPAPAVREPPLLRVVENAGAAHHVPTSVSIPAPVDVQTARPELESLFEQAKAYRALARHVTGEIEKLVPGVVLSLDGPVISFSAPNAFAALAIGPKGLRLYLDALSEQAQSLKKADLAGAKLRAQPYDCVAVLTDARAIDADLKRAIIASAARARS